MFDRIVDKGHFDEETSRFVTRQLLEALQYLHENGIAHRDIKPENILLAEPDSYVVKLSDFGLSRMYDEGSFMRTMCGTPAYVAPEVLLSMGSGGYTNAADVWSVGVLLYIMLSGHHPFDISTNKVTDLYDSIKKGNFTFPRSLFGNVSPAAIEFIKKMMTVDPDKRVTAAEALHDPWLVGSSSSDSAPAAQPAAAPAPAPSEEPSSTSPSEDGGVKRPISGSSAPECKKHHSC